MTEVNFYSDEVVNDEGDYESEFYLMDEIKKILRKVNGINYFDEDGDLNRDFLKQIKGNLEYTTKPKEDARNGRILQSADINFNMLNAITEVYVGLMLTRQYARIPGYRFNKIQGKNIYDYSQVPAVRLAMMYAYLKQLRFINTERKYEGKGRRRRLVKVKNPRTNKFINIDGKIYKTYYKNLILREVTYKDLTNCEIVDYEIKKNCVSSLVEYLFDKKTAEKYIPKNPTYRDILNLAKGQRYDCHIYDDINNLIDGVEFDDNEGELNVRIYGDHVYLLKNKSKNGHKEMGLKNFSDIEKYKDKKFIIKDVDRYKKLLNNLRKDYNLTGWNENKIIFKRNEIHCIPDYDKILELRERYDSQKHDETNTKMILSRFIPLKGFMNEKMYSVFQKEISNSILMYKKYENDVYTTVFDLNSAYVFQLYNNKLPVPTLYSYYKPYSGELKEGGFYYCELKSVSEFYKRDGWYYEPVVNELKEHKLIKNITFELVCETTKIKHDYLPNLYGKLDYDLAIDKRELREIIGCLLMTTRDEKEIYENMNKKTIDALENKYEEVFVNNSDFEGKYTLTFHKKYKKYKTGLLAWLAIVQLNNLLLFKTDKEVKKLNKDCILTRITTDSLGYIFKNKDYKLPNNMIHEKEFGKFKVEKKNDIFLKDIKKEKERNICPEKTFIPKGLKYKVNKYTKKDIIKLLEEDECIKFEGIGGVGKTYEIVNVVLPYLRKNKKKYILCSTTTHQAEDFSKKCNEPVFTIQSFANKTIHELRRIFDDVWYLIIDEIVQIRSDNAKLLEYIKETCNVSLIGLSDRYQCTVEKTQNIGGLPLIASEFGDKLFDCNVVYFTKHKHMRYDDELYNHLMFIIDNWDDKDEVIKYIKKNFNVVNKTKTDINIAYRHEVCKKLKEDNIRCITVHSIQGFTINEKYTIHDIEKSPMDVIFTAISRAKTTEQISIIL